METQRIQRLESLDVLRGITIALMIIVNSPGNGSPYTWLAHSAWNGCSLADLVFPFFIVIVGISCYFSLCHGNPNRTRPERTQSLLKISKRTLYLLGIGLFLNAFPYHFDLHTLRLPGVLQRIAICYGVTAVLAITTSIRTQWIILCVLLLGYWLLLAESYAWYPLTPAQNIVSAVDRAILSASHLYTPQYDPEGILSTLPAIGSCLLGNLIGYTMMRYATQRQQFQCLVIMGGLLCVIGGIWDAYFPWNKTLWTSSYVLWTCGLCTLLFAGCFFLIEIKHALRWSRPFALFGKNALLIYVIHILLLKMQAIIHIENSSGQLENLRMYITDTLFGGFSPQNAALCYAGTFTLLCFWILRCKRSMKVRF